MHSNQLLFSLIWMFLLKSAHNESTYVLSRLPFVCLILAETETDPDIRNDHKRIPCRSTAMRWIYVDVASIGECVCVCMCVIIGQNGMALDDPNGRIDSYARVSDTEGIGQNSQQQRRQYTRAQHA